MSTANWMPLMEPSRTSSTVKYEDVMAEFRANGRDSDASSRSTPVSSLTTTTTQTTTPQAVMQNAAPTPCSLCGACPQLGSDFVPSKGNLPRYELTSQLVNESELLADVSSASLAPNLNTLSPSQASQFASNMELLDLQNQFGAGLRKLLVEKPGIRPEASWPFLRRDFNQINSPTANSATVNGHFDNIWQLGGAQYARQTNLTNPIGGLNYQLQRLQQLRQKKPGFVECVFCRNNGEQQTFYRSHELKDQLGRVICPVLRAFTCPCCGATGDNAHTIKYCPEKGQEFIPDLAQLKALRIASGKRRVSLTRRYGETQELGSWLNQEQIQ